MSAPERVASRLTRNGSDNGLPQSGLVPLSHDDVVELPFAAGDVIGGKYQIVGLIGSGGMGYVVSAMHIELVEMVALKFLRREALASPELVERFAREARAAAKIKSEHVARVFDVGALPDGLPFIVMEYLEGEDLCDVLHELGPLPVTVAVEYVMQACEALASAHANGIVHRDIKPENLFLTRRTQGMGVIKVLDFGISKVALNVPASSSKQRVRTVVAMGSPVYMSPEQVRACGEVDARSDIWSLGCVLFELLTGEQPFDAPTLMQLGAAIVEHQPKRPSDLVPELPAQLEAVVLRCLEKDVTKRFQNIAELAVALYPFAPRRARIFAERCSLLLTGTPCAVSELDIKSIAPPAASTSGSSSAPVTVDGAAASRGRSARKRLVPVALVAAAAVTGGLIWSQIRSVPAPAAGVTIATPAAPAAAPSPAALAAPVTPSPEIEEPASPAPEASASAVKRAAAPTSKIRARKPAAPARSSSPRAPSLARDEEPDVGF